ncbi:MAG TPA: SDR family NAD(P)-dependent oxidoreductase, partial [Candidatus Saccharimonadia bacterium]|nr:SDR family NAD(P)-dependent oxidoreductase [Candidatus Saccharimonadia bacterium]
MLPFSLENQTAIVTGGGTGLGLGITRCLVQAGAKVVITGRREELLQQAATEIGPQVIPMVV